MSTSVPRPRSNRLFLIATGVLLTVLLGLIAAQFWPLGIVYSDPAKVRELETADLSHSQAAKTDWPQWRGPNRDGLSGETGLLTQWPDDLGTRLKVWEQPTGEGYSSLAVAGGRVFTLFQDKGNEAVVCWDAETGAELWRFLYPARYLNKFGNGPRSTPTVEGDRVYTVGATGIMHCLKTQPQDPAGEMVWRKDLLEEFQAPNLKWGVSFSPLIEGDWIYVNPGGPDGNSIAALNKSDGTLKWKALDDPAGYSSPMAATLAGKRQIVFFTGRGLVGVGPEDGSVYWQYPWETNEGINAATPVIAGDYVFASSGYGRGCVMLKIEADAGGKQSAQRVYQNPRMKNQFSSSVRYKDHLYGFNDSILTCMEFRTGKVAWTERNFDKGSLLVADGQLIILGENGILALAEATPEAYRQRGAVQFFDHPDRKCWSVPALANGRLYVRDEERIVCLDLRKNKMQP